MLDTIVASPNQRRSRCLRHGCSERPEFRGGLASGTVTIDREGLVSFDLTQGIVFRYVGSSKYRGRFGIFSFRTFRDSLHWTRYKPSFIPGATSSSFHGAAEDTPTGRTAQVVPLRQLPLFTTPGRYRYDRTDAGAALALPLVKKPLNQSFQSRFALRQAHF